MLRAVLVGVVAAAVTGGCGGPGMASNEGSAGAPASELPVGIVGDWKLCSDMQCDSFSEDPLGFRFSMDGTCNELVFSYDGTEYCHSERGSCTYEDGSMYLSPIPEVSILMGVQLDDSVLVVTLYGGYDSPDVHEPYMRIPDTSIGRCRTDGEECERDAQCESGVCDLEMCD